MILPFEIIQSEAVPEGTVLLFVPPTNFVFIERQGEDFLAREDRKYREFIRAGQSAAITNIGQES